MHYLVREQSLSLKRAFRIENRHGATVYRAEGPLVGARAELQVKDGHGTELAWIKEPFLSDGRTFELHRGGARLAQVAQLTDRSGRGRCAIVLDDDRRLEVDMISADGGYTIRAPGMSDVADVVGRGRDAYTVDTAPGQDDVLLLGCTIAIHLLVARLVPTSP
jgi:uncharacterized protein YxjI